MDIYRMLSSVKRNEIPIYRETITAAINSAIQYYQGCALLHMRERVVIKAFLPVAADTFVLLLPTPRILQSPLVISE